MKRTGKPEVVKLVGRDDAARSGQRQCPDDAARSGQRQCPDDAAIARAAEVMSDGGLVAFPTDTVYGLGADPSRPGAAEKIRAAKGREGSKPFARLASDAETASRLAPSWPELAEGLARAYWPGALTIVVGDVGLRVPASRAAREIASRLGGSLIATSANRSGGPEPRTAADVVRQLGSAVDMILDGGEAGGVPSTVVRVTAGGRVGGARFEVLREGAISAEELARIVEASEGDAT